MSDDESVHYHVEGSYVVHNDRDCYYLDNSSDVEELNEVEAEDYRTCSQCWYNGLSLEEKVERKRKSRRSRKTKITIRGRR